MSAPTYHDARALGSDVPMAPLPPPASPPSVESSIPTRRDAHALGGDVPPPPRPHSRISHHAHAPGGDALSAPLPPPPPSAESSVPTSREVRAPGGDAPPQPRPPHQPSAHPRSAHPDAPQPDQSQDDWLFRDPPMDKAAVLRCARLCLGDLSRLSSELQELTSGIIAAAQQPQPHAVPHSVQIRAARRALNGLGNATEVSKAALQELRSCVISWHAEVDEQSSQRLAFATMPKSAFAIGLVHRAAAAAPPSEASDAKAPSLATFPSRAMAPPALHR